MADTIFTTGNQAEGREAHESDKNTGTLARIATGVRAATLALAIGVGTAQAQQPSEPVRGPILMAQANVEKQEYVVYVRQVDENGNLTDKTIEVRYTKNERGVIVPPDTKGGKLLDGRDSTGDVVRDRATNRQIIGQYDKDKQIVLAMTDKSDIIGDASKKIQHLASKLENKQPITKQDIFDALYGSYIYSQGTKKLENERITSIEKVAKSIGISQSELDTIKQKAREEAERRWQSVTRSLG